MRGLGRQLLVYTFGLAAAIVVLEHYGAFSNILNSSAGAYATGFRALTGRR